MVQAVRPPRGAHRRRPAVAGRAARGRRASRTYLHVPSPGLLDSFVKDGARRFVFEGRECGGHVGPRSSFAAVGRAGRAAARRRRRRRARASCSPAASTTPARPPPWPPLAAPLAERGARIGVLMGTAYLFTEEAVAAGPSPLPSRTRPWRCERTVLLETSPGHATRCAETDYVRAFADAHARLEAAGVDAQDDVGRAGDAQPRAAAHRRKGLVRDGDDAARRSTTTRAARRGHVHDRPGRRRCATRSPPSPTCTTDGERRGDRRSLAGDAARRRRPAPHGVDREAPARARRRHRRHGGGDSPAPHDVEEFWANILAGANAVTEVPADALGRRPLLRPRRRHRATPAGRRRRSGAGSSPASASTRSPTASRPASLAAIEPCSCWPRGRRPGAGRRRLRRPRVRPLAGVGRSSAPRPAPTCPPPTGCATCCPSSCPQRGSRASCRAELDDYLPELTEDSFPGVLANVIAGRIANRLDLGGVELHRRRRLRRVARRARRWPARSWSAAPATWCCAAAPTCTTASTTTCCSPRSTPCRPPAGAAPSTPRPTASPSARASPAWCSSAWPTPSATATASTPWSRPSRGSRDGRAPGPHRPPQGGPAAGRSSGPTPRPAARRPSVGLVEAHGTGTVVGDGTELATLTELFDDARRRGPASCVLGLGEVADRPHQVRRRAGRADQGGPGALPRRPAADRAASTSPTRATTPSTSPFRFHDRARPWADAERRAGVSAPSASAAPTSTPCCRPTTAPTARATAPTPGRPSCSWSGRPTPPPGARGSAELATLVAPSWPPTPPVERHRLRDLARTDHRGGRRPGAGRAGGRRPRRPGGPAGIAGRAASRRAPSGGVFERPTPADAAGAPGRVPVPRPGQPAASACSPTCSSPSPRCTPTCGRRGVGRPASTRPGRFTQASRPPRPSRAHRHPGGPARPRHRRAGDGRPAGPGGRPPDVAGGHSYGELVALSRGRRARARRRCWRSAPARGEAVHAAAATARRPRHHGRRGRRRRRPGRATLAAPPRRGGGQPQRPAPDRGRRPDRRRSRPWWPTSRPPASAPARCPWPAPSTARSWPRPPTPCRPRPPAVRWTAPADPRLVEHDAPRPTPTDVPQRPRPCWPTRWPARCASSTRSRPCTPPAHRVFVEAGPGRVLTELVGDILGDRPHAAVACDVSGEQRRPPLPAGAGRAGRGRRGGRPRACCSTGGPSRSTCAPSPLPAPGWAIDGHIVPTADGAPVAGGLRPADQNPVLALGSSGGHGRGGQRARRRGRRATAGDVVADYLHNLRETVAAERDVLMRYLDAEAGGLLGASAPSGSVVRRPVEVPRPPRSWPSPPPAPRWPRSRRRPRRR